MRLQDTRPWIAFNMLKGRQQLYCIVAATSIVLFLLYGFFHPRHVYSIQPIPSNGRPNADYSSKANPDWIFDSRRDANNYGLTSEQCSSAFPGLFDEVERVTKARRGKPIRKEELTRDSWPAGTIRVLVWENQIYVIDAVEPTLRKSRVYTTLHMLNRALMGSSDREPLRNVEFIFSIEDWTIDESLPIWSYDRKPTDKNTWLIPDFGFYAWPEPGIGTYSEVRRRMFDIDTHLRTFSSKIQKLVWRGAIEAAVAPVLRQNLITVTTNKSWADVQILDWTAPTDAERHRLAIEDHCKYAFIQHTEGRAWSGRLKYVQNCHSVIVAHKLEWIQHYQHLLVSSGPNQNFVEVERDFSDLEQKMEYLVSHPEEAERIASNSVAIFRDRYLTPAAEACYWRRLIKSWGEVSFEPDFYKGEKGEDGKRKWRGVPFESFAVMKTLEWEPF